MKWAEQQPGGATAWNRLRSLAPWHYGEQAQLVGSYNDAGGSSTREALSNLLAGKSVDLGSGFVPGGNRDPNAVDAQGNPIPLGIEERVTVQQSTRDEVLAGQQESRRWLIKDK